MSLVVGTNCGFVTTEPTADPVGSSYITVDTYAQGGKFTSPSGNNKITKMGWWCDNATEEANFQLGIYDHDSDNDRPGNLLASSGDIEQLNAGSYTAELIVYDPINSDGIVWDRIKLQIED